MWPPSGVVGIAGIQQLWIGKNHAGKIATLWMDLTSIHVIVDDAVVKTVLSRLTTTDLERLQMRGARPGRSAPAVAAVDITTADERIGAIEIDRTADRNGIVKLRGHQLKLGVDTVGSRVTLRIDGNLIHAAIGKNLIKTMPNPLGINEIRRLTRVRKATTPLPPPPAAGPQTVQRRIPKSGQVMIAGQRIRVGATHAGIIVNIVVEDHHFRVLDGTKELSLHARTTAKPLRVFNAHRPQHRKLSPEDRRTRMS